MDRPIIAVTMGDPSGVGPEIALKALSKPSLYEFCLPFIIGDLDVLQRTLAFAGIGRPCRLNRLSSADVVQASAEGIAVLDLDKVDATKLKFGSIDAKYGKAAGAYIEKAVELALSGKTEAIATCPIQKESFSAAGYSYPGHTDMLAELTGTRRYALMLMVDDFRVVHVTLHTSLKNAASGITSRRVYEVIEVAREGCLALGLERPRIGVAGLNPHAGEGGLFGNEEKSEILPAIERAKKEGFDIAGPFSPDTIFALLHGRRFDIVVCMYHDQGGIPMKLLSFQWDAQENRWSRIRGVNVTLGLPIIRTSVSHGTGFEIAGRGIADSTSLEEAVGVAAKMARIRCEKTFSKGERT